jgi:cytidine deaminase
MSEAAWSELRQRAREARGRSHCPYSGFAVGAAVRGSSGAVYTGANVEVSSYGLTLCAERLAVFKAIEAGEAFVDAVAVVADTTSPVSPCGACRQVIHDFGPHAIVLMERMDGERELLPVSELLPRAFTPRMLLEATQPHGRQLTLPGIPEDLPPTEAPDPSD